MSQLMSANGGMSRWTLAWTLMAGSLLACSLVSAVSIPTLGSAYINATSKSPPGQPVGVAIQSASTSSPLQSLFCATVAACQALCPTDQSRRRHRHSRPGLSSSRYAFSAVLLRSSRLS